MSMENSLHPGHLPQCLRYMEVKNAWASMENVQHLQVAQQSTAPIFIYLKVPYMATWALGKGGVTEIAYTKGINQFT